MQTDQGHTWRNSPASKLCLHSNPWHDVVDFTIHRNNFAPQLWVSRPSDCLSLGLMYYLSDILHACSLWRWTWDFQMLLALPAGAVLRFITEGWERSSADYFLVPYSPGFCWDPQLFPHSPSCSSGFPEVWWGAVFLDVPLSASVAKCLWWDTFRGNKQPRGACSWEVEDGWCPPSSTDSA